MGGELSSTPFDDVTGNSVIRVLKPQCVRARTCDCMNAYLNTSVDDVFGGEEGGAGVKTEPGSLVVVVGSVPSPCIPAAAATWRVMRSSRCRFTREGLTSTR